MSATTIDSQMPSTCQKVGKINTAMMGNIKTRRKDKSKEIAPFDKAVKKEEMKILNPQNKKHREYNRKPRTVKASNSRSESVKIFANGSANPTAVTVITTPSTTISILLLCRILRNSPLFSAP